MSNPKVTLTTNHGDIVLELNLRRAPNTVENFINYVRAGHYEGTIFHRVIESFMIQGGGFTTEMEQKKTENPIENEADNGLSNEEGAIAMARTADPHSASCQFFINTKHNDFLNFSSETSQGWGYCVFGKVIEGMDVVNSIKTVDTGSFSGHQDVPTEQVIIEKAEVSLA